MALGSDSGRGMWSNRWLFVLAAAGSAVGLGNIWKFPYITGENGGGAFVLIYLVCVAFIGIPIMVSEVMLGRKARSSPIHAMRKLTELSGAHRNWTFIGWMGVLAGFLILSYYAVIAGWALNYIVLTAGGTFTQISVVDADKLEQPWHVGIPEKGEKYVFNHSGQELDLAGLLTLYHNGQPCANAVKDSQATKTSDATTRTLSLIWGTKDLPGHTESVANYYSQWLENHGATTARVKAD